MSEFTRRDDLPGEPTSPWLADTLESGEPSEREPDKRRGTIPGRGAPRERPSDRRRRRWRGVAGLSTAIELRERGQTVVVLERDRIATGVTGKSTAKLTSQHGLIYDHLRREFGRRQASQYARIQEAAIDTVEQRIDDLEIDCGFERHPAYLYSNEPDEMEREAEAARAAGLSATYVTSVPPFERAQAGFASTTRRGFTPEVPPRGRRRTRGRRWRGGSRRDSRNRRNAGVAAQRPPRVRVRTRTWVNTGERVGTVDAPLGATRRPRDWLPDSRSSGILRSDASQAFVRTGTTSRRTAAGEDVLSGG